MYLYSELDEESARGATIPITPMEYIFSRCVLCSFAHLIGCDTFIAVTYLLLHVYCSYISIVAKY
jgi:hypothetical protein